TSTVTGQHKYTCHQAGSDNGGTCGDFEIMDSSCGGSIRNCSSAKKEQYFQIAKSVFSQSSSVKSCLNEYVSRGSQYSTGNHFHCNL
ncbi:MAG: hypothetical protein AAB956_01875, partial [Patescibacteria group bacterium]